MTGGRHVIVPGATNDLVYFDDGGPPEIAHFRFGPNTPEQHRIDLAGMEPCFALGRFLRADREEA